MEIKMKVLHCTSIALEQNEPSSDPIFIEILNYTYIPKQYNRKIEW